MKSKEEIKILEQQTSILFNKFGFKSPRRILPNIIFDWMTPEYCFKIRMRTILSEMRHNTNYAVTEEGKIITENNEQPILIIDNKRHSKIANEIKTRNVTTYQLVEEIKTYLKGKGFDLNNI